MSIPCQLDAFKDTCVTAPDAHIHECCSCDVQVDLTYAVGKFLVEQARGNTHAPASPQEENSLLIYNYQTTFTGKVSHPGGLS